jgi:hypothetical protein
MTMDDYRCIVCGRFHCLKHIRQDYENFTRLSEEEELK